MTQPEGWQQYPDNPQYPPQYQQYPPYWGQPPYGPVHPGPPPNNHLALAIVATVLCCLPFGIVAIVKANQVQNLWFTGNFEEARRSAESAKTWALWSILTPVGFFVLYFLVVLVVFLVAGTNLLADAQ